MQFKFPFKIVRNDKLPFLDIRITNKDKNILTSYRALLDSGAYANIFHSDIARVLDINLSKIRDTELFIGVKEEKRQMKGKPYVLELMVMQKGKSYKFDCFVVFSGEISNRGYAILGRQGFFDQFNEVCFNYKTNKFYLQIE